MRITVDWLRSQKACDDGIEWFLDRFPHGADLADVMPAACAEHQGYGSWLAKRTAYSGVIIETDLYGLFGEVYYSEEHYRDGKLHREDGPAWILTRPSGYRYEQYRQDGEIHREGGPAVIETDRDGLLHLREAYYRNDKPVNVEEVGRTSLTSQVPQV